ncbi:MAG: hypothetical protein SVW57_03200 [Thermodesulfobacteriota bacterium]|nr:hypothetical protein [Thermodesulfobacteriota bacterium]
MISSPCIHCSNKNQPKDKCVKFCEILNAVQDHLITARRDIASPAVDYTDENRFSVSTPTPIVFEDLSLDFV